MASSCSTWRIVLAEDNDGDVGLVREALRAHKVACELKVISDGEEVLSFIKGLDADSDVPCPDLLLLDLHLPKRDGREVMEFLRSSERCARTPIVVLTASDSPRDRQTADKNAAIHYFQKPSSFQQFLQLGEIVKEVIQRAQTA